MIKVQYVFALRTKINQIGAQFKTNYKFND